VAGAGRVVVFGDVIDDILVSPSAPIRVDTDTPSSIRHRAGGSAANTAAWLGFAGAPVDFVGIVARDDVERHSALLRHSGVTPHLSGHPTLPTGTIVVLVEGELRSMLTERGANGVLHPDSVTDELLDDAAILHLTGYSVVDSADPAALRRLMDRALARGVEISLDPGSAGYIADFGSDGFLEAVRGASLLFPNLAEARVLTGESDPLAVAASLATWFPVVALTLGADGAMVTRAGRGPIVVPGGARPVVEEAEVAVVGAFRRIRTLRGRHHCPVAAVSASGRRLATNGHTDGRDGARAELVAHPDSRRDSIRHVQYHRGRSRDHRSRNDKSRRRATRELSR